MGCKKTFPIDCADLKKIKVSRPACLAIVASACEVFPTECIGTLCSIRIPKRAGRILAAFPFQLADREDDQVESESYGMFRKMLSGKAPWYILGSYHSHPCSKRDYKFCSVPSESDLEDMETGELEVIVRTMRRRRRKVNYWRTTSAGNISIAWGRFQFLIRAFVRLPGFDGKSVPMYRSVDLELEE